MQATPLLSVSALRATCLALCGAAAMAWSGLALARSHALILTIDYQGTQAALPGIDKDAQIARRMAAQMGVPEANIRSLSNRDLTKGGLEAALSSLASQVGRDDNVFIYYSGHGAQTDGGNGGCQEGMVGADLKLFADKDISGLLNRIVGSAARVVVMNDSCFSGGQYDASKSTRAMGSGSVPKLFNTKTQQPDTKSGYSCGEAINKTFRSLAPVARQRGNQFVYLAAASEQEVAFATPNGSAATVAWERCLNDASSDADRDGNIDGNELRVCAQGHVDRLGFRQTVSMAGSGSMPLSFLSGGSACQVGNPHQALQAVADGANADLRVSLQVANPRLRIGKDMLDFTVRTEQAGYLYLLHVGTEGKVYQLFPNKIDSNNYVASGSHRFPRDAWGLQAQGPAGKGSFLAVLTQQPRDMATDFNKADTFAESDGSCKANKSLGVVSRDGRYGASTLAFIEEVN